MGIREAGRADVEALSRLAVETYSAAFGRSMSAADLQAHIQKHLLTENIAQMIAQDRVLIAEIDGRMAGFVQTGTARSPEDAAHYGDHELRRIYVHEDFQNQKIGTRLMRAALEALARDGARGIFLDVWERNEGARRFYEGFGFRTAGTREFVVESGAKTDPDLIMVLEMGG